MTDLDPVEPTEIGPGLTAIPLAPTVWDDLSDGQHAVTPNGAVFQRRKGQWHMDPWWQNNGDGAQIAAICADPDGWAYDNGWPRKMVEDARGPLAPIALPGGSQFQFPHDDDREMKAFVAGWFGHARNPERLVVEDAWRVYRLSTPHGQTGGAR